MSSPSRPDDDSPWRRPADGEPGPPPPTPPAPPVYSGPPVTSAPPPGWRPPVVMQSPPPRVLPQQDLSLIETAEQQARTLTYGAAMVAGAIMLVLLLVLCGRLLF